jgi:hypothetical protein
LVELGSARLGVWLAKYSGSLKQFEWEILTEPFRNINPPWRDTLIASAVMRMALNSENEQIRVYCLTMLRPMVTLSESISLISRLKSETDPSSRLRIIQILCRYKNPINDSTIQKLFRENKEMENIRLLLDLEIKTFTRHGLLPDLYALRSRLQKEKDVTKIADAKETLDILKDVIPYLEQKKAEGAQVGLPLDWGMAK